MSVVVVNGLKLDSLNQVTTVSLSMNMIRNQQ